MTYRGASDDHHTPTVLPDTYISLHSGWKEWIPYNTLLTELAEWEHSHFFYAEVWLINNRSR
jgi:hypothetical protein